MIYSDDEESTVVRRSNYRTKKEGQKSAAKRHARKQVFGKKSKRLNAVSRSLAEGERGDSSRKFYHDSKYNFGLDGANPKDDRRTLFQSVRALGLFCRHVKMLHC